MNRASTGKVLFNIKMATLVRSSGVQSNRKLRKWMVQMLNHILALTIAVMLNNYK